LLPIVFILYFQLEHNSVTYLSMSQLHVKLDAIYAEYSIENCMKFHNTQNIVCFVTLKSKQRLALLDCFRTVCWETS